MGRRDVMQRAGESKTIEMMDGRIWIFDRTDRPTPYWYARFRVDGERKPVVRSTRKRRLDDAKEWAREYFYELVARKKIGLSIHHNSFKKAATAFLVDFDKQIDLAEIESADKARRKKALYKEYEAILERYLIKFFDQTPLEAIGVLPTEWSKA